MYHITVARDILSCSADEVLALVSEVEQRALHTAPWLVLVRDLWIRGLR